MEAKHTPGPWKWHKAEAMIEAEMPNFNNEYEHVCDLRTHALNGTYNEADARLIAACPDLLYACKGALDYLSPKHNNGHTRAWTEAMIFALSEAIAKATGETL